MHAMTFMSSLFSKINPSAQMVKIVDLYDKEEELATVSALIPNYSNSNGNDNIDSKKKDIAQYAQNVTRLLETGGF